MLRREGFTLLEVLIAISVLVVVVGIVYESLDAVTNATETARAQDADLRVRDFLLRSLSGSLSTVYTDPGLLNPQCQLVGKKGTGGIDSLEFCSSAPLMGGASEPGLLKHVHYGEAENKSDAKQGAFLQDTEDSDASMFEATERLVREPTEYVAPGGATSNDDLSKDLHKVMSSSELIQPAGEITPTWTIPVAALSFLYFDGKDWVEEWDSMSLMRLPWCVRIRVNFARSPEDGSEGGSRTLGPDDEGDFQMYVPIPAGMGVHTDAATWQQLLSGAPSGGLVPITSNPGGSTVNSGNPKH